MVGCGGGNGWGIVGGYGVGIGVEDIGVGVMGEWGDEWSNGLINEGVEDVGVGRV